MRSPIGSSDFDAVLGAGDGSFDGSGDLGASGVCSSFGRASLAALAANSVAPERSSPSSARMAIVLPTATFFEPSWAYDVVA